MGMSYPTARDEQAAYWYLKLQESTVSAQEIQDALAWQQDPENLAAFRRVEAFWTAWPSDMPAHDPRSFPQSAAQPARWTIAAAAAAVVFALIAGLWLVYSPSRQESGFVVHEYASDIGQIRTVRLDDGTEAIIGGATFLRVEMSRGARRIAMSQGEASFRVAKDAARPFVVMLPNGSARALGTQFNVHRGPDETTIAVLEGRVSVDPPGATGTTLVSGTAVSLSADGRIGDVKHIEPQVVMSWRSGRLVFLDRSLRSIVADLNRYSRRPIRLTASSAADTHLSGSLTVPELEQWLRAVAPTAGVAFVEKEHEIVLTEIH